jgi:hypothetical protein
VFHCRFGWNHENNNRKKHTFACYCHLLERDLRLDLILSADTIASTKRTIVYCPARTTCTEGDCKRYCGSHPELERITRGGLARLPDSSRYGQTTFLNYFRTFYATERSLMTRPHSEFDGECGFQPRVRTTKRRSRKD